MNKKNIVLLGKGDLSIKIADYLNLNHNLLLVVPDRPEPSWTSSLTKWCVENKINLLDTGNYEEIDDKLVELGLSNIKIDFYVSIFYGKIIKKSFIENHSMIVNLHNAPLPKYRGVRPINWALLNNENYHGVTIHKITPGIDDGPILGKITYPIYPDIEEVVDVYNKSLEYGWILFKDVFGKIDYIVKNLKEQDSDFSYYSNNDISKLGNRSDFRRDNNVVIDASSVISKEVSS